MSFDDVAEKFRDCADHAGWPDDRSARAIDLVGRLDELEDVAALTRALSTRG